MSRARHIGCLLLLCASVFVVRSARGDLLYFPLTANERGTVVCLEHTYYTYDIYMPPGYSKTGTPLPILYTMYPTGGGMVSTFLSTCSNLNVICVGITGVQNGETSPRVMREIYAVARDIRERVNYDPTAEFVGGFSGGAECSYLFSRMRAQHVAGVLAMGGWLGRVNLGASVSYYGLDRVQTNLLVARSTGNSDTGTVFYNPFDSNYLATCGAVIQDWSFIGNHEVPATSTLSQMLSWLLSQRVPAGPNDRTNANLMSTNWQARLASGDQEGVFRECVSNVMTFPRTWFAYQAQLTLDQLMTNYTAVRPLDVSNLAQGDFASDFFFYYAYGASTNSDWTRYNSCMKALTGITVTNDFDGTTTITGITETVQYPTTNGSITITTENGDRFGDIYWMLTNYHRFPAPLVQAAQDPNTGQMDVWVYKDTPGLAYSLQSRSDLVTDVWQDATSASTIVETNTYWSASADLLPGSDWGFYRVGVVPEPATSPPWVSN